MISDAVFPNCCGLRLLHGEQYYQTAEAYFKDFAAQHKSGRISSVIFQVGGLMFEHRQEHTIGKKIVEYIEKHGLGVVNVSPPIPNPVHGGRPFIVYTWIHNRDALRTHLAELSKPSAPKVEPTPVVVELVQPTAPLTPPEAPKKKRKAC